jgi:hypothetical protein|tara:strand:- start:188 stop:598 length:411 start_codon:yes stop_codon:yes gene_type:complete
MPRILLNEQQKKENRIKSHMKYLKSEKGKLARSRALKTYYTKNQQTIIDKNKKYYEDTYSKVVKEKRGTGKKKGANVNIINHTEIKFNKEWKEKKIVDDRTYLIKDEDNKTYRLTTEELRIKQQTHPNLKIMISFD